MYIVVIYSYFRFITAMVNKMVCAVHFLRITFGQVRDVYFQLINNTFERPTQHFDREHTYNVLCAY